MVAGSNPVRRTISQENPIKPWFVEALEYQNTTLLQLHKDFLKTDTSYLQKIKDIYYLVYKYKSKIIKKSLRSSNLQYCNIEKLKMIKIIQKELGLKFDKVKSQLEIDINIGKGDDPEAVEQFKKDMKKRASELFADDKIKTLKMKDTKKISISDAYKKFLNYMKSTKKASDSTMDNYNSAMSYLNIFIDTDSNISSLDSRFWNDLQSDLIKTPRDYIKTPSLVEKGIFSVINHNEQTKIELENKLKKIKDKDLYDTLRLKYKPSILQTISFTTINKHFSCYNAFMRYLDRNDYMENTIKIETLDEEDSPKETFLYREIKELFNYSSNRKSMYEDIEYQNMFKFAFLSGMRRGEILKITKKSIVRANGILCIDIQDAKNEQSIRLVPISKDMKKLIDLQFKKSKNGYLFFDEEIRINNTDEAERTIGKRINRIIDKMLIKYKYEDKSIKSFHSLRGNCIQELYIQYEKQTITSELYIKMLVGHKAVKNITFNTYNKGKVSIEILNKCIETITLDLVNNPIQENKVEISPYHIEMAY